MRTATELPPEIRRIVLTGFMGAGKSTIGALLAQKLGWNFLDSDTVIETNAGMTVAQIFDRHGEADFRLREAQAIRDHSQSECLVLALGGGALESDATRAALAQLECTCTVFLDAPLETMVARCLAQPGAAERPVLADRERLAIRLAERLPHYRKAHLTLSTSGLTPHAVAEKILEVLGDRPAGLDVRGAASAARHLQEGRRDT
jgi:shikimate kinase